MGVVNQVDPYKSVAEHEDEQLAVRDAVVGNPNDYINAPAITTEPETTATEPKPESPVAPQPDKAVSETAPASGKSAGK